MKNGTAQTKTRTGLIAALDVGTTKCCCLIARPGADRSLRIVGIGHHGSQGLRSGAIADMDAVEASVRATVEAAERMAGENIREVVVNLSGGNPTSRLIAYDAAIDGREIGDGDLRRILDGANFLRQPSPERRIIHAIPLTYSIDGSRGVRDPRGMYAYRLGVNMHVISAQVSAVRNLTACISRCHLAVEATAVSSYAAALATVDESERKLGSILIDMGGGTTSLAVFFDGDLVHTDVLPVGGSHVTSDVARGLSTPLVQAERIKTLHGSVIPTASDDREVIKVPTVGEEGTTYKHVPRSMLVGIIRPRVEETIELVRSRLEAAGFSQVAGRRVVLTGGASQLPGVPELAGMILDKQVRIGRPRRIPGLAEAVAGPAFATSAGLLEYAVNRPEEAACDVHPMERPQGRLGRLGQWLRENF